MEDIRTAIANEIDELRRYPSKSECTNKKLDVLFTALTSLNSIQDEVINNIDTFVPYFKRSLGVGR